LADRGPSKLDVLADSASMLSRVSVERVPTQSARSTHSARSFFSSERSERSSLRSFDTEETDDEHRDKKPKLRSKQSMPSVHSQPIYLSGRSKRKMPVREKGPKEPLHFNVSNVTKWRPANILHTSSKGKEAAQEAQG
jgi:hypothetical protein